MTHFFLLTTVVVFSFHLAGHIFDKIAIIPNWNSGSIDDMKRNKAFFRKGQIQTFFVLMLPSCFLVSLVSMVLLWNDETQAHLYSMLAFALNFATSVWTIAYFVPMNKYFEAGEYEAETLKQMVKRWTMANHIRFVLLTIALGLAIAALNSYTFK